jgi:hypothetical protein
MAISTAYLTSTKNVGGILDAIKNAQAPPRFTTRFLQGLGYSTPADRLMIGVLKALGFLSDAGVPQDRYFRFLDKSQSSKVLAESIRDAYADLFQINVNAHTMSRDDVKNKLKTLTQGQHSEAVLAKMATTFKAISNLADFSEPTPAERGDEIGEEPEAPESPESSVTLPASGKLHVGGLVYNLQIVLPESRDPAVYDALFRSLREHLA